jgi:Fe-S-cluster containining protein
MNPPCSQCTAVCCRQTAPHVAAVFLEEHESGYETIIVDDGMGEDVRAIPYVNGNCFYLVGNQCSIYERRPILCREFTCLAGYNLHGKDGHGFFLEDHPEVVELIELNVKRLNH